MSYDYLYQINIFLELSSGTDQTATIFLKAYSIHLCGNTTYPNRANRPNRLDLPKSTLKMAIKCRRRVESVQSTVLLKKPCIRSPIKVYFLKLKK